MFKFIFGNDYQNSVDLLLETADNHNLSTEDLIKALNQNPDKYGPFVKEAWNCVVKQFKTVA